MQRQNIDDGNEKKTKEVENEVKEYDERGKKRKRGIEYECAMKGNPMMVAIEEEASSALTSSSAASLFTTETAAIMRKFKNGCW